MKSMHMAAFILSLVLGAPAFAVEVPAAVNTALLQVDNISEPLVVPTLSQLEQSRAISPTLVNLDLRAKGGDLADLAPAAGGNVKAASKWDCTIARANDALADHAVADSCAP